MHIFITGGTSGIGNGLVKYFLSQSQKVSFTGLNDKEINETMSSLEGDALGLYCDVRDYSSIEKAAIEAKNKYGDIDIWINNAGVAQAGKRVENLDQSDIDLILDVNLKGAIYGTSIALKQMNAQGHGMIYNIEGYGSNDMMSEGYSIYGTSKRGIKYFIETLRKENTLIKIGMISPGMVTTGLLLKGMDEKKKKAYNILADKVDTVVNFIGPRVLLKKEKIVWLTTMKAAYRFMSHGFTKRKVID